VDFTKFKAFENCNDITKRRKTLHLRDENPNVLSYATKVSLKRNGNKNAAKIIYYVCINQTVDATKVRKFCEIGPEISTWQPKENYTFFYYGCHFEFRFHL
jgi:hypothetical protein